MLMYHLNNAIKDIDNLIDLTKKDIEDIKPQLMAYLTQQLQNDKISLLITLVPLTAEHKAISNVDKIRLLKKKRPEFENMIQQLGLDPE